MATAIAIGAGVTIAALAGRAAIKAIKQSGLGVGQLSSSKYLRGGFEQQMSTREAFQILSLKESSSTKEIKKAHRNMMLQNHPDRGGSPYLASKINEAKEILEKRR
jgi:DnaJ homolog subfamily C member 19